MSQFIGKIAGIYVDGKIIAQFTAPLSISSNEPVFVTDTLSLRRRVSKRSTQRWQIEASVEPLSHGSNELFAHLVVSGHYTPVDIITPQQYGVIKNLTATGSGSAIASGVTHTTVVSVTGAFGEIPRGTMIRFENHNKVYMTTAKKTGSGTTLNIYPPLRQAVNNSRIFFKNDVIMKCFYDTSTIQGLKYIDGILGDVGTVHLIEAL